MSLGAGMVRLADHCSTIPVFYCVVFLIPRFVISDNQMFRKSVGDGPTEFSNMKLCEMFGKSVGDGPTEFSNIKIL